jgi:acyl-CoA thioesterase FadM
MKQQRWRHDAAAYGPPLPVAARWSDVDTRRHVNNIAVYGLHQEARQRWWLQQLGDAAFPHNPVAVRPLRTTTEFWHECHYPQPVDAGVRLLAAADGLLPQAPLQLASGLFQHGVAVGAQHSTLAAWPADLATPQPWPAAWLSRLPGACPGPDAGGQGGPAGQADAADGADPADAAGTALHTAADHRAYAVHGTLASRYGDLDADGCTSELAGLRAIEQARALTLQAAFAAAGGEPERDWVRLLVARIDMRWAHHRPPPPGWALAGAVLRTGRSSVVLRVAMLGLPNPAHTASTAGSAVQVRPTLQAVADCVMVYTRPEDNAVAALPAGLHAALAGLAWRGASTDAAAAPANAA